MSLEGKSRTCKRKSGAADRKEMKAQIEEERKLGSFMLNVLQTTETDTPAVLSLTRDDRPAVALDLTSLCIHDDSLPTISCLESCTSVTILLLLQILQLFLLMATLYMYWKYTAKTD